MSASKEGAIFSLPYSCADVLPPSAWQQGANASDLFSPVFDLAIIGAGIGGAALVNRAVGGGSVGLPSIFPASVGGPPSVAIFEKAAEVGGRLMSAAGTGGLGTAVVPADPALQYPPPEVRAVDPPRVRGGARSRGPARA